MTYLFIKALLSGVVIAAVSEVARRNAAFGALIASLPLVSLLAIIWLWRDTHDVVRVAAQAQATIWYILPSLVFFITLPWLLRRDTEFWMAMAVACGLTITSYAAFVILAPKLGIKM